jgi:hypothetical protein
LKEFGEGSYSVYVWYDPDQEELAKRRRKRIWKCKIGSSRDRADLRILRQKARTAIAGRPVFAIEFHTDERERLEKMLHTVLEFAGKHIKDAGGHEWFLTNPTEVAMLYHRFSRLTASLERVRG